MVSDQPPDLSRMALNDGANLENRVPVVEKGDRSTQQRGITRGQFIGVLLTTSLGLLGWHANELRQLQEWAKDGYALTPENKDSSAHLQLCLRHAKDGSGGWACFDTGMSMALSQHNAKLAKEFATLAQDRFKEEPLHHYNLADRFLQQCQFAQTLDPLHDRNYLHKQLGQKVSPHMKDAAQPVLQATADGLEPMLDHLSVDLPPDIRGGIEYALKSLHILQQNIASSKVGSEKRQQAEQGVVTLAGVIAAKHFPPSVLDTFMKEVERIRLDEPFNSSLQQSLISMRGGLQ